MAAHPDDERAGSTSEPGDDLDEGLTWDDERDPTHVAAAPMSDESEAELPDIAPGISSPLLVTFGVFGAIFLLYAVGWLLALQRNSIALPDLVFQIPHRANEVLAIAAPPAWFVGTLALTQDRRAGIRLLWLVLGVLVLAPWPFILGFGTAS